MKRVLLVFTGVMLAFGCGIRENKASNSNSDQQEVVQMGESNSRVSSEVQEVPATKAAEENLEGVSLVLETLNEEERELFLSGAWEFFFPTPAGNWGHRFRDNYVYRYVDFSREALEERYWFTDGEWRIEGDEIQVKILSYRISDRDAVDDVLGFRFPEDAEYITVPVNNDTWHTIGTMKSIRTGIVRGGWEVPPRITLRPLRFDRVLDKEVFYYRDRP